MDSPCIKQTVCKVLNIFQHGKYLVAYVLKGSCTRRCKLEQDHDGAMVSHLIRYKGVKGTTHQDIFIIISD